MSRPRKNLIQVRISRNGVISLSTPRPRYKGKPLMRPRKWASPSHSEHLSRQHLKLFGRKPAWEMLSDIQRRLLHYLIAHNLSQDSSNKDWYQTEFDRYLAPDMTPVFEVFEQIRHVLSRTRTAHLKNPKSTVYCRCGCKELAHPGSSFVNTDHKDKYFEMMARHRQYKAGTNKWRNAMRKKRKTIRKKR